MEIEVTFQLPINDGTGAKRHSETFECDKYSVDSNNTVHIYNKPKSVGELIEIATIPNVIAVLPAEDKDGDDADNGNGQYGCLTSQAQQHAYDQIVSVLKFVGDDLDAKAKKLGYSHGRVNIGESYTTYEAADKIVRLLQDLRSAFIRYDLGTDIGGEFIHVF